MNLSKYFSSLLGFNHFWNIGFNCILKIVIKWVPICHYYDTLFINILFNNLVYGFGFKVIDKFIFIKPAFLSDFYATWCPPCKGMIPIMEQISEEMKDRVIVLKINFDENKYLAKYLKIENFPTFFIYKNGEMVWRRDGAMEKSELQLIISKY